MFFGKRTDGRFFHIAQRKQRMRQLILRERIEHIALILCRGRTVQQPAPARFIGNAGVMTSSNVIHSHGKRLLQHGFKFNSAVAFDAGIRCAAALVLFRKGIDHIMRKSIRKIHHIMRNPQPAAHTPCVLHIVQRAASSGGTFLHPFVGTQLHGDADHLITLLLQQQGRNGAVHSAAHAHHYFFRHSDCSTFQTNGIILPQTT